MGTETTDTPQTRSTGSQPDAVQEQRLVDGEIRRHPTGG